MMAFEDAFSFHFFFFFFFFLVFFSFHFVVFQVCMPVVKLKNGTEKC